MASSRSPETTPASSPWGGELNKIAANVAIGRNMAGVHWRSDYTESLRLGERIAIQILQEQAPTYNEQFSLTVTTFDGDSVTIDNSSGRASD
jgi:hypothetical protein